MPFLIKQEKFEGPFELLLELIEQEKLSISEVSLGAVADAYLQYVRSMEVRDPEGLAEFLVVAAELLLVKSKTLLPNIALTEEEEGSIEELERRLTEYKQVRALAEEIRKLERTKRSLYTREEEVVRAFFYPPPKLRSSTLVEILSNFISSIPKKEKLVAEKIRKIISLDEKIQQIQNLFHERIERAFSEMVSGAEEKVEVIISFLAILELAKQQFFDLRQNELFDEIMIRRVDLKTFDN